MNLAPVLKQRFFDANGVPLAGGQLFSYVAGTTTPQATYSNAGGTANTNPVVLDAQGYADVWIDPTLAYKFILQDSGSNTLWTEDNVTAAPLGIAWNSNTVYSQGAIVQDASGQGLLYVSLIGNNQNQPLTTVGAWRVFSGNVRTLSVNTTLAVTDDLVRSNSTSGNLTHTLPPCSTTPIGKEITIKDVGTGGNTTAVKGSGTDNVDGVNTFGTALIQNSSAKFRNNGTSWDVLSMMADGAVTTAKIAALAVTQAKRAALPYAVSGSSGAYSTTSTLFSSVTNLSATLTTIGRPVLIMLVPDGSTTTTSAANITAAFGTNGGGGYIEIQRDGTTIGVIAISSISNDSTPVSSSIQPVPVLDTGASAGSHTYTALAAMQAGSTNFQIKNYALFVYEL